MGIEFGGRVMLTDLKLHRINFIERNKFFKMVITSSIYLQRLRRLHPKSNDKSLFAWIFIVSFHQIQSIKSWLLISYIF